MENLNKEALASQVSELEAQGSIAKAKAWWAGLSKMQKAAVIGMVTGGTLGIGYGAYALHVGATVGQAFWATVFMGTLTGVAANAFALGCYAGHEVVEEQSFSLPKK